jgi:mannitol/fructose-specific phosphotransferase system IIA component (Ntr-type)
MKQIINQLIQLQDLSFTLEEQRALTTDTHLKALEKNIAELAEDLPADIRKTFKNLLEHYDTAVVPMAKGICTGCGFTVPTILAYEVQIGQKLIQCPRCTRVLYYRDTMPRQLKRIPAQLSAGIARFSSNKLMIPQLQANTKEEALEEMLQVMSVQGFVEKPEVLLESALDRESIVPTAVDHGLAFPHVRGVEGGGLIFSAAMKGQGLHFGAPRNRRTRILFFIVIPLAASAFYLHLITGLMETFSDTEARRKLLECKTPDKMWKILGQLTKKTIP